MWDLVLLLMWDVLIVMFWLRSLCRDVDKIVMCRHVCLNWDPFDAMLARCSLLSYVKLCHADRSPLVNESSYRETSRGATPAWGNIPCMIEKTHSCTSSLFLALNAASYTILTPGLGDVVPLGRTPLSMSLVLCCWFLSCSLFCTTCIYVPLCSFKCNFNNIIKVKDLGYIWELSQLRSSLWPIFVSLLTIIFVLKSI